MKIYDEESKTEFDVLLEDDGTLDTVISVNKNGVRVHTVRFNHEYAIGFRSEQGLRDLANKALEDYFEMLDSCSEN